MRYIENRIEYSALYASQAFSEEKGFPGFCAGFARKLTDKMADKLVPKFSEEPVIDLEEVGVDKNGNFQA